MSLVLGAFCAAESPPLIEPRSASRSVSFTLANTASLPSALKDAVCQGRARNAKGVRDKLRSASPVRPRPICTRTKNRAARPTAWIARQRNAFTKKPLKRGLRFGMRLRKEEAIRCSKPNGGLARSTVACKTLCMSCSSLCSERHSAHSIRCVCNSSRSDSLNSPCRSAARNSLIFS